MFEERRLVLSLRLRSGKPTQQVAVEKQHKPFDCYDLPIMRSVIDFGRFKNQVLFGDAPPTVVCRTVRPSVLERVVLQNKDTQYIFHPSDWTRDGLPSCSPNEMSRAELDGEMIAHVGNSRKVPVGECEYWGECEYCRVRG